MRNSGGVLGIREEERSETVEKQWRGAGNKPVTLKEEKKREARRLRNSGGVLGISR